jgi:amino acid transporter
LCFLSLHLVRFLLPLSLCVLAGFDAVSVVAQEARSTKALPRATLASLTLSTLLYLAIATVAVGVLPYYVRTLQRLLEIMNG